MPLPEKHILSKSTFIRSSQCLKSLYLYKNHFNLRDPLSENQKAFFKRGTDIGILAQNVFPGGVDASPQDHFHYPESVAKTAGLIESGVEVIYEAAFQFEGILSAIDILVKKEGKWFGYEVKSSAKISGTYMLDAALQYFVITSSGIELEDIFILNLNTSYVKNGPVEPGELFNATSVKKEVLKLQEEVKEKIKKAKGMLNKELMPEIKIGKHCFEPYPCDFRGYCWKDVPEGSVFELAGMSKEKLFEMYDSGTRTISQINKEIPLHNLQKMQVDFFNRDKSFIDKGAIKAFLQKLKYPLYFLDFETFMPAVPIFDGTSPFQNLPFQYSVHFKENPSAVAIHKEFLAETGINPSRLFIENLLKDTETPGDIIVYNLSFERGILFKMIALFPELEKEIQNRIKRMKDLMQPFQKLHYYHPLMKGSHSIKNVLPALVPELNYDNLQINNGNSASAAFEQLQNETDLFKMAEIRTMLSDYCKLDTLAMVKILEVLEKEVIN